MRQGRSGARWRGCLTQTEADRVRQLDEDIAHVQRTILAPLAQERERIAARAHMRMIRAARAPADADTGG